MSVALRVKSSQCVIMALMCLWVVSNTAHARIFSLPPLEAKEYKHLPKQAQEAHDRAMAALDRINYDVACDELNEATKAAPQCIELHFMAIKLAKYRAQMTTGLEATHYLDDALDHCHAVLQIPDLPSRQKARAEYEADRLEAQRKTIDERDEARRTYGMQIVKQYAKEVYTQKTSSAEIKAFQDAVKNLMQGGTSQRATAAASKALSAATAGADKKPEGAAAAATSGGGQKSETPAPAASAPAPSPAEPPAAATAPAAKAAPKSEEPPPPPPPVARDGKSAEDSNPFGGN